MHLATRRVLLASCTTEPNEAWVAQQARNLSWRLAEDGIKLGVVIHDRHKKFARAADNIFKSDGARVILTHLQAVLDVYCAHYNDERPHRSCGLRPPATRGDPLAPEVGEVRRRIRLAGLLSDYYREAA